MNTGPSIIAAATPLLTYAEMARLHPRQWVAFVAHGAERYEVIGAGSDLVALMRDVAAGAHAGRASFAHLRPREVDGGGLGL